MKSQRMQIESYLSGDVIGTVGKFKLRKDEVNEKQEEFKVAPIDLTFRIFPYVIDSVRVPVKYQECPLGVLKATSDLNSLEERKQEERRYQKRCDPDDSEGRR